MGSPICSSRYNIFLIKTGTRPNFRSLTRLNSVKPSEYVFKERIQMTFIGKTKRNAWKRITAK